jgi:hypothetical protein
VGNEASMMFDDFLCLDSSSDVCVPSSLGACTAVLLILLLKLFLEWVFQKFLMSLSVLPGNFSAIADHLKYRKNKILLSYAADPNHYSFQLMIKYY